MKKLIYILNFFVLISLTSCEQNSSEKKLIGKWYGIENNGYTRMQFYPDSLVFAEFDKEVVQWNANNSEIEFYLPTIIADSTDSPDLIEDKIIVKYRLSKKNDTLFGIFKNRFGEKKINLLKAENQIEFLKKRFEIDFSLPEDNSAELIKTDPIYGLNVFIGYSNNKILGKTELSENLNNLESDIKTFKDSIKPYELYQIATHKESLDFRFHLRVFADKSISDSTITKYLPATIKLDSYKLNNNITLKPKDTLPIRIYRIYQSHENKRLGNMKRLDIVKGKQIKTIANNVYKK